jgi:hypothetical protein
MNQDLEAVSRGSEDNTELVRVTGARVADLKPDG